MANLIIVIAGGGIAGLSAATEIRAHSAEADLTLLSKEKDLPYYRLSLTRYLAGEIDKSKLPVHPEDWYAHNRIKLSICKEVIRINRDQKAVELADGEVVFYDKLILTTGADPMVPPIPGKQLENVLTVRTIEDADHLLEKLKDTESCVCIGGGLLGLETAGAIVKSGVKVTLIEIAEWLMPRQLNQKASKQLKQFIQNLGMTVKENAKIKEIVGSNRCEGVLLESGELIPAGLVVITAGIRPNTALAREAGLTTARGLVLDETMHTSDADILGAGDLAEINGALGGLWNLSQQQGKLAGLNAIGIDTPFKSISSSHALKVLGMDMFSMGDFAGTAVHDDLFEKEESGRYYSFVIRDKQIIGSIVLGDRALSLKVKSAIEKNRIFSNEALKNVEDFIKEI